MHARPSTSGGPSAKASAFLALAPYRAADKTLSKDDLYLPGCPAQQRGFRAHRIAAAGGLPTPHSSPDLYSPNFLPPVPGPAGMHSPEYLNLGEAQIGMALGSPTQPPETWPPLPPPNRHPPTPPEPYEILSPQTVQRQKTQRRKLFGNWFGSRKKEGSPGPSLEDAGLITAGPGTTTTVSAARPSVGALTPNKSQTATGRKAPKHKPLVIGASTVPDAGSTGVEYSSSRGARPLASTRLAAPKEAEYAHGSYLSPNPAPSSGLLDVEIPSIKLERYSVMFSNVLNPQATGSTLLARRQITLEKLKAANERIEQLEEVRGWEEKEEEQLREPDRELPVRQRRATSPSPQPSKTPGFTLFPVTAGRDQGVSNHHHYHLSLSRLARASTSPALLPSPSRPALVQEAAPGKEHKAVVTPARTTERRVPPPSLARPSPQPPERTVPTAEAVTFRFAPEVSGLILDSPQSTDVKFPRPSSSSSSSSSSSLSVVEPLQIRRTPAVLTGSQGRHAPPSSSSASYMAAAAAPQRLSQSSTSVSSLQTYVTRASIDADADAPRSALKTAVEISIARPINISRQQRSLLLRPPLPPPRAEVPRIPPGLGAGAAAAAASAAKQVTFEPRTQVRARVVVSEVRSAEMVGLRAEGR